MLAALNRVLAHSLVSCRLSHRVENPAPNNDCDPNHFDSTSSLTCTSTHHRPGHTSPADEPLEIYPRCVTNQQAGNAPRSPVPSRYCLSIGDPGASKARMARSGTLPSPWNAPAAFHHHHNLR